MAEEGEGVMGEYQGDGFHNAIARERDAREASGDELARLRAERDALCARVAELEAPPVVPEGCVVRKNHYGFWVTYTIPDDASEWVPLAPATYRALAWAIEHDQRPPHAEDEKVRE